MTRGRNRAAAVRGRQFLARLAPGDDLTLLAIRREPQAGR